MAEQDQRQAGILRARQPAQDRHVVDGGLDTTGAELAEVGHARRHAVTTMIGRVDQIAGLQERLQRLEVAHRMLAGAVRELNDRLRVCRTAPDKSGERRAVFTQVSKRSICGQSDLLYPKGGALQPIPRTASKLPCRTGSIGGPFQALMQRANEPPLSSMNPQGRCGD